MKPTASTVLLLAAIFILAGVKTAPAARCAGTFSVAKRPIAVSKAELRSKLRTSGPMQQASMVAMIDNTFSATELAGAGWRIVSRTGEVVTLEGNAATGPYLSAIQGIRYIQKPGCIFPQLDSARRFTMVDQVHGTRSSGLGRTLTGKNVLIGVIDTEFDTRHPAFLDSTGALRFVAIWDQDDSSTNDNRYKYGVIKNHAQLVADSLFGLDANDVHGTMTTSLAAGSDRRFWKGPVENAYYGMAPDALLAGVKIGRTDAGIIDGLHWLFSLADSLRLPCVVNISLGDHYGPHDGTSLVDRAIDNNSAAPGHIVVGAAGNDGDKRVHRSLTTGRNDSQGVWITPIKIPTPKGNLMFSGIELWGEAGKTFTTTFFILDTLSNVYVKSVSGISTNLSIQYRPDTVVWFDSVSKKSDTVIFEIGTERSSGLNNKPHLRAYMTGSSPHLFAGITVTVSGSGGMVHAWNLTKQSLRSFDVPGFFDGDSTFSINELGGTAKKSISVGAYENKLIIPLWNGGVHDWGKDTTKPPHSLTTYSSQGPTADNRIKPDIAAPGSDVTCALPRNYRGDGDIVIWPDTSSLAGRYISTGGTSVASPIVAGIVAMLLEIDPSLTADKTRQILQETAINDTTTGSIGANYNNRWGAGKVNALGAASKLLGVPVAYKYARSVSIKEQLSITPVSGNRLRLHTAKKDMISETAMEIYSINGRCMARLGMTSDGVTVGSVDHLSKGYYMVRAVKKGLVLCSTGMTIVE